MMWEWGTVAARRLPEATHAPVGAVSTAMSDFFYSDGSDGSYAAEVNDLSEIL
jgi:hypothetical protein